MKRLCLGLFLLLCQPALLSAQNEPGYLNPDLSVDQRAQDLVGRLTLDEKIAQLNYQAPAIDRLSIPAYNWWNEALHGVARNGRATVFPQAIALGATWDDDLIYQVASAISDEARAKYNASQRIGNRGQYAGLTFWSPNINIFRDPRWGRGQETYGEDPYLTGRIGVAFVHGLQGNDPRYLKAAACAKHYGVHSGPEGLRHEFDAAPPQKDFRETYLPAFQTVVTEGKVEIVMCAYNSVYDVPACASNLLLQDILRKEWDFQGHVTSDCWALVDFYEGHGYVKTPEEAAAAAFKAGVDVNCGSVSPYLKGAVEQGLITEAQIDSALTTLMKTRFRLGLFDPADMVPYSQIGPEVINSTEHRELARKAAEEAIVMLKNDGVLPLRRDIQNLQVVGPNAANADVLLGNYYGVSGNLHTILEGISEKVDPGSTLQYAHGFLLDRENVNPVDYSAGAASGSDAVVVVMGLTGLLEGEEGESPASPTKSDRFDISLPKNQIEYLKKLRAGGDAPLIVVLTGGSPVAISEVEEIANAILYVWYPGEEGGRAVANVLFGDTVPSGRLPLTFPKSVDQLPPYDDYSMVGRTYKYMKQEPLYPFGFGLSYTSFEYANARLDRSSVAAGQSVMVEVTVTNTGKRAADEVVQCYLSDLEASVRVPLYDLKGFQRVFLWPGQSRQVRFEIPADAMKLVDNDGKSVLEPGQFRVTVGGSSPGARSLALGAPQPVSAVFTVQ